MVRNEIITLLVGFIGVFVGSLTSILTVYIQGRFQWKKDRDNLLIKASIEHFKLAVDVGQKIRGSKIYPYAHYLFYQMNLFKLLDKNKLNRNELINLFKEEKEFHEMFDEVDKQEN